MPESVRLWSWTEETPPLSLKTSQALEFWKSLRLRLTLLFCGFITNEEQPGEDERGSEST